MTNAIQENKIKFQTVALNVHTTMYIYYPFAYFGISKSTRKRENDLMSFIANKQ